MVQLGAKRREERLLAFFDENQVITAQKYNIILCGTVFWGLLVNLAMCKSAWKILLYVPAGGFYIGTILLSVIGIFMTAKSQKPVISFIGYNLMVISFGLILSVTVAVYGGLNSAIVQEAFLITVCITGAMTLFAISRPEQCERFGVYLLPCLIGMLIAELIMMLFHMDNAIISWISAALFSMYIAYDVYRSQQFPKTVDNAIDCAADIYLDIINLFINILEILGRSSGKRRR